MNRLLPLALLTCLPLCAQEDPQAPPKAATTRPATVVPLTVTLSFWGGTVGEFVAAIAQADTKANIVVAPEAAAALLPAMELKWAGLEQALEAACLLAKGDAPIRVKEFRGNGSPVYTIIAAPQPPTVPGSKPATGLRTEVVSLNRVTDGAPQIGFPAATVLSAIEMACEGIGVPTMRVHKESGILVLRGSGEQIDTAWAVLRNLERDADARRKQDNAKKGIAPAADPAK